MKRNGIPVALAATLVTVLVSLGLSTTAEAHGTSRSGSSADRARSIVDRVAPPGAHLLVEAPDGSLAGDTRGARFSISTDARAGLAVTLTDGRTINVAMPRTFDGSMAQVVGTGDRREMVYARPHAAANLVVRPATGGAQALISISDESASEEFSFDFSLPTGTRLVANDDGSAAVTGPDGNELVSIAAPWAIDAAGNQVATSYSVDGSRLVQSVHHRGANYPVVADPLFTWGLITGTVYFNHAETTTIASAGWGAASMTTVCALVGAAAAGPVGAAAMGAACFVYGGSIVYTAGVANNSSPKKCLKVKVIPGAPLPTLQPGTYTGGYCA